MGLIEPTREIKTTGEEVTLDGVKMVFQMTPGRACAGGRACSSPKTKKRDQSLK
jgi:alkyl sulfatase BDS1-like metallo-beta-lactamase superfamily hydrolase